ncbi:MAG: hypothetical protein J5589_02300 [Firmicutes bacterium]|nr:hypothetical protein [Bacillota bacterium]
MAITAKELVRKYKNDPQTAKRHLTFLQTQLMGLRPVIYDTLDLPVDAHLGFIRLENTVSKLASNKEKTDEELEKAFQQMLNTQKLLDVSLGEKTFRDALLGGDDVKAGNKNHLKQFDTFFGTTLSKPGKTIATTDKAALEKLTDDELARSQSASAWIKGYMKMGNTRAEREANPAYLEEKIALIMAARKLSGCKRDDKATLIGTDLTESQIREEAAKLKNDPTFKDFMKKVSRSEGWNAAVKKAMGTGHAGGLDTLFTKFIAEEYAPGKMPNDPSLERYMPTAKQRIEALQLQEMHSRGDATWGELLTATGPRPGSKLPKFDYAKASAEVLVLRNMIKAERDHKATLNRKIPTDGTLAEKVNTLVSDKAYKRIANSRTARELFAKGHGGKMIEEMRKLESVAGVGEPAKKVMNANTIGARIREIQETAGKIRNSLMDDFEYDEEEQQERIGSVEKLTKEYYVLNEVSGKKNQDGTYNYEDLDKNLLKDVPYSKIDSALASPSPLSGLSKDAAEEITWEISNKTQQSFFNDAVKKEKGIVEEKNPSRSSSYETISEADEEEQVEKVPTEESIEF